MQNSPRSTAIFRDTTDKHKEPLNHRRQFCLGHKRHFSAGQFADKDSQYCNQCKLRGVDK